LLEFPASACGESEGGSLENRAVGEGPIREGIVLKKKSKRLIAVKNMYAKGKRGKEGGGKRENRGCILMRKTIEKGKKGDDDNTFGLEKEEAVGYWGWEKAGRGRISFNTSFFQRVDTRH